MSYFERERLLLVLKSLTSGQVYGMAPRNFVLRGIDYFRAGRLRELAWGNSEALFAIVKGSKKYTVSVSEKSGSLSTICDCPAWSLRSSCKHVVCTLLSLIDLLGANSSAVLRGNFGDRTGLLRELFGESKTQPAIVNDEFSIAVIIRDDFADIRVLRNGTEAEWDDQDLVPRDLRWLILRNDHGAKFSAFLSRADDLGAKYPVVLRTGAGETVIKYDRSATCTARTGFDASADHIKMQRLFLMDGAVRSDLLAAGPFVFDVSGKTFSRMGDTSGWRLFEDFHCSYAEETAFIEDHIHPKDLTIPIEPSGTTLLFFPAEDEDLLADLSLKVDGMETPLVTHDATHRITISRNGDEGSFALRAGVSVGGATASTFSPLFSFFPRLTNGVPQQLKALKRREVMIRAFFEMLSASTDKQSEKALKQAMKDIDLSGYIMKRKARRVINDHFLASFTDDRMLLFHEDRWLSVPVDKAKEVLLYRIPYEIFGWEIFREPAGYDTMTVKAGDLFENLPLLYERLRDAGFSLYFEGKLVRESSFEFSFDVTGAGIDWFEIRPEIRCDGQVISEEVFNEMLRSGGTVEEDGCLRIMDTNSKKMFSMLSTVYRADSGERPGRKEIVKVPRLRIIDWMMLRKSGVTVRLPAGEEEIIERLLAFEKIEPKPLPSGLKAILRNYQLEGYSWLSFLYENCFGACLADDMGLGKTLQAICLLAGIREGSVISPRRERGGPHLIVLPPSLLFNWENEIQKFYPHLRIGFYTGKERTLSFEDCDAVLTTYGLVRRDCDKLSEIMFDVIIFDEAQAVKNIFADTTGAVRKLKANFKLAMTGTPLENHVGEYYSIVDLVLPGLLGDYDEFRPMIKSGASPVLDLIIRRTKPFVLRRTKDKILRELPLKIETDIYLDLTEKQKALYKKTVEQVRSDIDDAYRTRTKSQASIIALTAILKLRQICVAPRLVAPSVKESSPKIDFLIEQLKELLDEGHGALVFSQFTSFLDLLEEDLSINNIPFSRLDGSTQVQKRKKLVEGFQSGDAPSVFLLSLKAGGQGLNLTRASYVFHLDPWWNPAVENQASDRAHRIGQKRKVTVTRVLMRHTIEEKMMTLKKKKQELYNAVMEGTAGGGKGTSITKEDFEYLLGGE